MNDLSMKLSAYLDGELDPTEADAIEALLDSDPDVQEQLEALVHAQAEAQDYFDAQLNHPVSLSLVKQIQETKPPQSPSRPEVIAPARPIWGALAASLVALVIGGAGGYLYKDSTTPVQVTGWLSDIADYHGVYASQARHLVEVGADEADHIEAWLGKTVGASFSIPDLTEFGLTFEGGRLLVANGKPVAQLMYRQADGTVIALCLQRSNTTPEGQGPFKERTIKGFDFVSWTANGADYVVIGPAGQPNLNAVATQAALDI
jgi:anti-sigma factor RsiW